MWRKTGWIVTLSLATIMFTLMVAHADTVTTKNGMSKEGKITEGLPGTIAIETAGGTLQVELSQIQSIELNSQDTVTTQDGSVYKGEITSELSETLKIEITEGIWEVPWDQVKRISFSTSDVTTNGEPTSSTGAVRGTIKTSVNTQKNGTIYGFPDSVEIKTSSGNLTLNKGGIKFITFGDPATIQTREGSTLKGQITTKMPNTIRVEQEVGTLHVSVSEIKKITFSAATEPTPTTSSNGETPPPVTTDPPSSSGAFTLGAGFSYLPSATFALGAATAEVSIVSLASVRALAAYGSRTIEQDFGTEVTATSVVVEAVALISPPVSQDSPVQPYIGAGGGLVTNVVAIGLSSASGNLEYVAGLAGVKLDMFQGMSVFTEVQYSPTVGISLRGGVSRQF